MSFTRFLNNGGNGGTNQGFSRFISSPTSKQEENPYDLEKVNRQIDNARTRIEDAGYTKQDADKRNWFEKATNLPQNQNWFFDTLEILGRPANAVKNVIDKTIVDESQNVGKALYRGLSGQDHVLGSELVEKAGIENKVGKFALGTGLDILIDPITYIPGGAIAKGIKGGAGIAAKPIKAGYEALESASPGLKALRENRIAPAVESAKDSLGYMFNPDYKKTETLFGGESDVLKNLERETENTRRYMQEESLKTVTQTAQKTGVEAGSDVGRIMESNLRQFEDVPAYQFPGGRITENKADLLQEVRANKGQIKEIGQGINATTKEYQQAIGEFADGVRKTDKEIEKLYVGMERQATKELDKTTKANLREGRHELKRIEDQLENFGKNEESMLKHFKRQVRDNHEMKFDLAKQIRAIAPNGIKGVERSELPGTLQNLVRASGKAIDEIANELGYTYADDLMQDLKAIQSVSRRLDPQMIESMARKEMERTGALQTLQQTKRELEATRQTLTGSIKDIRKSNQTARATEKAFEQLADHPEYIRLSDLRNTLKGQLDSLKSESKAAKQENINRIKEIESEIGSLQQSIDNPVTIQKELPRPQRELSTSPQVQQAAANLMQSNTMLRQYAADNGIAIHELEGYMTHILAQAEREARKNKRTFMVDRGSFGKGNPNKKILESRKLMGSAEDVNEQLGKSFFEPNAYFSTAIGQRRLIDYVQAVQFRRKVLSDRNFAVKYKEGMEVAHNAVVIDTNNYKFIKESGDDILKGMGLADEIGGQYIVTKAAKQALDRYQYINTDEGTKAFLKALGGATNTWKKFALFSPGYHVRNFVGNMWNSYAAGMRPDQLAKYSHEAMEEVAKALRGKESEIFNEFRREGLLMSGLTRTEFGRGGEPEKAIEKMVEYMSKSGAAKVGQKFKPQNWFQSSRELGETADMINRFSMYKWARDKKMDPKQAAEKVREALFDYMDLTPFEQKFMKNLFPFYTWTRKNVPFQIQKFIEHPDRFQKMNYMRQNAQDATGLNEETVPDYMKENFYMPIYGKDGKGKMLGLNLPLGDLAKVSNPLKLATDSLTPLLKTPIELGTNYNTFRGKKIKEFEGQEKKLAIPFTDQEVGIPIKAAYALEQATGQIGRGVSNFLQKPDNVNQDDKFRKPSLGISSFVKDFDAEKYNYFNSLDELRQLQDLIRYIEQQEGQKPRTLAEIRKAR